MTRTTATTHRLAATAALVLTTMLAGVGVSAASAGQPADDAGNDYVRMLLAKAEAAKPYSQADDYVDTLVYWHNHPQWGFES